MHLEGERKNEIKILADDFGLPRSLVKSAIKKAEEKYNKDVICIIIEETRIIYV